MWFIRNSFKYFVNLKANIRTRAFKMKYNQILKPDFPLFLFIASTLHEPLKAVFSSTLMKLERAGLACLCGQGITGFTFKTIQWKLSLHLSGGSAIAGTYLTEDHYRSTSMCSLAGDLFELDSPGGSSFLQSIRTFILLSPLLRWPELIWISDRLTKRQSLNRAIISCFI